MGTTNNIGVTRATLGRLPKYLEYLKSLSTEEYPNISATVIAKGLGLGDVQVRKDLGSVSGTGKPKTGYVTEDLIRQIESYLSPREYTGAVIVGAGKLGRALLDFDGFGNYGLDIVAAFDCDDSKAGRCNSGKSIYTMDRLEKFCADNKIRIGIITVPGDYAQEACDELLDCGIRAIWNFAPRTLKVPEGVIVQQENLALSLAYLKEQCRLA